MQASAQTNSPQPHHHVSSTDYLPIERLRQLQTQRLQHIVRLAYDNVALYRERMDQRGVRPNDIQSIDDIQRLPYTVKNDLRDTYPYGMFAVPMSEVVRVHASSGTTGKPIVVAYNEADIGVWTNAMVRALAAYGLHRGDILQNSYGYGLFTGGLGLHYGGEGLGATVIPTSGGATDRQIMIMKDFGVSAISCTPSYFLRLIDRAAEMGIDIRELPVRVGIFGAEPWTEQMRVRIEEAAGIKAYDIYGLSEIVGPGVGAECCAQQGVHIFEDYFYPEIIDPDTEEPLPDGEPGELVLTTLGKEAMPMLRYRTRDITTIVPEPCPCGRTIRRIRRITHRSDDMLIIRGVNVYPSQIETALLAVEGTLPHYQIIVNRENNLDQLEVLVEVTQDVFSDRVGALVELQKNIEHEVEQTLRVRGKITLVEPNTLQRSEGKAKRVLDQREM